MRKCSKCDKDIPVRISVNGKVRIISKRKYCLECSPFGKHNTRKLDGSDRKISARNIAISSKRDEAKALYESGSSLRNTCEKVGIAKATISHWIDKGYIKRRMHKDAMRLASQNGHMRGAEHWTEEQKEAARERMLKRIKDDPNNHPNRKLAGNRNKMSFPEKLVFDVLTEAKIAFIHNARVLSYYPDFLMGNKIIEIDGKFWHNAEKDKIRDEKLSNAGYVIIRIPAKDVLKNPKIVLEKL